MRISVSPSGCKQKTQKIEKRDNKGCNLGVEMAWTRAVVVGRKEEDMEGMQGQQTETRGPYHGPPGMSHAFSWLPFSIIPLLHLTPWVLYVE